MSLTVLSLPHAVTDPRMFFDLNGQDYQIYYNREDLDYYDIVIVGGPTKVESPPKCGLRLELQIFHNHEYQSYFWHRHPLGSPRSSNDSLILTNAFDPIIDGAKWVLLNDFLFNRTKAYYTNYVFNPDTIKWYYAGDGAYILPDITFDNKQKIFVSPNNTHAANPTRNLKYRPKIVEVLRPYQNLGYLGNQDIDKVKMVLYSQLEFTNGQDISDIENYKRFPRHIPWGYNPPHSEYYKNTFISIYGETIEWGSTIAITEKTYDPMIKGHFVLPFSSAGFIQYVRDKGFKFPNFINYDYDIIKDDDQRFAAYCQEIHRLMAISLDNWQQLWKDNLDIILFNREKFFSDAYDRADLTKYL